MVETTRNKPSDAELISWALERLADGDYWFNPEGIKGGWELTIEEPVLFEDMEFEVFSSPTEEENSDAFTRLRENCNPETTQAALVELLGPGIGKKLAGQLSGASYEKIIKAAFQTQRRVLQTVREMLAKGQAK